MNSKRQDLHDDKLQTLRGLCLKSEYFLSFTPVFSPVMSGTKRCVKPF